jgi:fructokinase
MRIGIDVGGTKIEGIALDDAGRELARTRVPTPPSYTGTLGAIADLVHNLESQTRTRGSVGVGIPGASIPETGLIKNANSVWLIGRPLERDLADALGREVRLMNDANCFTISEATDGAAVGQRVVFGVILGTGVGGGIVVDGKIHNGPNLIAGEWGHNPLPWMTHAEFPGPRCYCGKLGCIELFVSGPGFERDYAMAAGRPLRGGEIVSAANAGDETALAAVHRYHDRLARSLASVINLLDPDVIVLGGGMSNLPNLAPAVSSLLPAYVFSNRVEARVVRHVHGDSSGVRGAAWLWPAGDPAG